MQSFSVWGTPVDAVAAGLTQELPEVPVVLCLGSSKVIEDSLGPMVGTLLLSAGYPNYVYGTVDAPIHSKNLEYALQFIRATHPRQKLLVVDASTTAKQERLGRIVLASNYTPANPRLQGLAVHADLFVFGISNLQRQIFPELVGPTIALVQKLAASISGALMSAYKQDLNFQTAV